MGGLDKDKAREVFSIPEDFEVGAAWAIGYLVDPSVLPDQMKAMETAPRSRNPIEQFVFSAWDKPASL